MEAYLVHQGNKQLIVFRSQGAHGGRYKLDMFGDQSLKSAARKSLGSPAVKTVKKTKSKNRGVNYDPAI